MEDIKELQKKEAVKRLKMLKVLPEVINEFKEGVVYYSERQSAMFDGILYWVSNKPEYEKAVKDFEEKYGALVYHAQLMHTCDGDMLSLLYVGAHQDEWEQEEEDLRNGETLAYVSVMGDPALSEIGFIGIKPMNGGVSRTY